MNDIGFDFSDSVLKEFYSQSEDIYVHIQNWEEKEYQFRFFECCYMHYELGDVLKRMEVIAAPHETIETYVRKCYEDMPDSHEFKLFRLIDIHDDIHFETVAKRIEIKEC